MEIKVGDFVASDDNEATMTVMALEGDRALCRWFVDGDVDGDEQEAWIDLGFRFLEPWVYPMGPDYTYVKAFEWEVREFPATTERVVAPAGLVVEVKWLDVDEFAHWSSMDEAELSRAPRKRREQEVQRALLAGEGEHVEGLHRVLAPPGVHVIDHVVDTWLPQAPRPLVRRPGEVPETRA